MQMQFGYDTDQMLVLWCPGNFTNIDAAIKHIKNCNVCLKIFGNITDINAVELHIFKINKDDNYNLEDVCASRSLKYPIYIIKDRKLFEYSPETLMNFIKFVDFY